MGWEPSFIKQWTCIGRHFVRISSTPLNRINKRIALWAHSKASPKCKIWFYSIKERLLELYLRTDYDINRPVGTEFVNNLRETGLNEFKTSSAAGLIVYIVWSVRQVEVETNCEHTACLKVY